jgi:hypothetical protein
MRRLPRRGGRRVLAGVVWGFTGEGGGRLERRLYCWQNGAFGLGDVAPAFIPFG